MQQQHASWIAQARQHWKEFQPTRFKELAQSGKLETELRAAAEATSNEMQTLVDQGFSRTEAWELVREVHLFPPEETEPDEPESEGYAVSRDLNQMLANLRMPGERDD
jgi:Holliday junction resolvasome RuvABC DNA-binding subunit